MTIAIVKGFFVAIVVDVPNFVLAPLEVKKEKLNTIISDIGVHNTRPTSTFLGFPWYLFVQLS